MMKRILTTGLFSLIYLGISVPALAAPTAPISENLTACARQGNVDFVAFLESIIYADGLTYTVVEQFNDVTVRNRCQSNDVTMLLDKGEELRSQIRDSFLSCQNYANREALIKRYEKLIAEIYYVRNVVDNDVILRLPTDEIVNDDSNLEIADEYYYPPEKLYENMRVRYVENGRLNEQELSTLFQELENKYSDRKESYIFCRSSDWDKVSDKWKEFMRTSAGTLGGLEGIKKTVSESGKRIVEMATDSTFEGYFSGVFQQTRNNLQSTITFSEIAGRVESGGAIDQQAFVDELLSTQDEYDWKAAKAEVATSFELLYRKTSDDTYDVFQKELDDFNKVIEEITVLQSKTLACTQTINKKQCPISE